MSSYTHFFSNQIYHIQSESVAKNHVFREESEASRFLKQAEKYLEPVCTIINYSINETGFQLIIKIHSRERICAFYRTKYNCPTLKEEEIDLTSYIISQQFSNLLASTAIAYNRKYKRKGSVFARRFSRTHIESKKQLEQLNEHCDSMQFPRFQSKFWSGGEGREQNTLWRLKTRYNQRRSGLSFKDKSNVSHPYFSNFVRYEKLELRGQFKNLSARSIYKIYDRLFFLKYSLKNDL